MPFSEIIPVPGAENIDLAIPPKGVSIERDPMKGTTINFRKIPLVVFFLIPFTAAWSGASMFGIYGSQIRSGHFNLGSSLFGLPFLIGTMVLLSLIIFMLFGRWRFRVVRGVVEVVLEIGLIGWTRRIECDASSRVSVRMNHKVMVNGSPQSMIQVESKDKTLKFGMFIPDAQKTFIAEAIRRSLKGS